MSDLQLLDQMLRQVEVSLSEATLKNLVWLRDELLRWNRKINLTAITNPIDMLEKHLVDSLTLLPFMENQGPLLDMGSGGGFPSIPLKLAMPHLSIWSVDSVAKKISFQKHIVRSLNLQNFRAQHARLEDLPGDKDRPDFSLIVSRAFAPLEVILSLAEPLLLIGGQVVAMKGAEGLKELSEFDKNSGKNAFECIRTTQLELPRSKAQRTLLFFRKKKNISL